MSQPSITRPAPWTAEDGEGRVRGKQLTGPMADILSLEDNAMAARAALAAMSRHLRGASCVGNPAPIVEDMRRRLSAPTPGDLVVENTSGYWQAARQSGDWYRAIGIFLLRRDEWLLPTEEPDGEGWKDEAWYIQYGPAPDDVCRWSNCDFEVVPWTSDALPRF